MGSDYLPKRDAPLRQLSHSDLPITHNKQAPIRKKKNKKRTKETKKNKKENLRQIPSLCLSFLMPVLIYFCRCILPCPSLLSGFRSFGKNTLSTRQKHTFYSSHNSPPPLNIRTSRIRARKNNNNEKHRTGTKKKKKGSPEELLIYFCSFQINADKNTKVLFECVSLMPPQIETRKENPYIYKVKQILTHRDRRDREMRQIDRDRVEGDREKEKREDTFQHSQQQNDRRELTGGKTSFA